MIVPIYIDTKHFIKYSQINRKIIFTFLFFNLNFEEMGRKKNIDPIEYFKIWLKHRKNPDIFSETHTPVPSVLAK